MLDETLLIAQMNTAAETLLGVSMRRVTGRAIGELVHPSTELVTLCRRALASGLTFSLRELTARVGDHEVVLDCRAAPLEHERFFCSSFSIPGAIARCAARRHSSPSSSCRGGSFASSRTR